MALDTAQIYVEIQTQQKTTKGNSLTNHAKQEYII